MNTQPAGYLVAKSNKHKISTEEEKIIPGGFIISSIENQFHLSIIVNYSL